MKDIVLKQLRDVIPCLQFSKDVHQEWIDWYIEYPEQVANDLTAGGPEHHVRAVAKYDARLKAVKDAILFIEN